MSSLNESTVSVERMKEIIQSAKSYGTVESEDWLFRSGYYFALSRIASDLGISIDGLTRRYIRSLQMATAFNR